VAAAAPLTRALIAAAATIALVPSVAMGQGLTVGFADGVYTTADASLRDTWLTRTSDVGATIVRLDVGWPADRRPEHPTDPGDPAYDWARADAAVDAARAHGLEALLGFTGMPAWARTRGAPAAVGAGTWRPNAALIGQYGQALAAHFAGRASLFEVWNEPNRSKYLTPQWSDGSAAAPVIYRAMLNAFYAGVKRAQPHATVVTAGTAGRGSATKPMIFWRTLLRRPARFDVLAHHPGSAGGPTRHALNAADVAVPDMGKLRRLLHHAHRKARLWVTGLSFDSSPAPTQARWLEHSFELLWRAGVDTITWSQIRDLEKPALTAFRFPFVAGGNQVWTRAPLSGTLQIQRDGRTVRSVTVRAGQVLLLHGVRTRRGAVLRGLIGPLRSLPWRATH
jgi:hypothetical protein